MVADGTEKGLQASAPQGSVAPGETQEEGAVISTAELEEDVDPETVRRVRQIASALSVPQPPRQENARRGLGDIESLPFRGGEDEIDLEATVDRIAGEPVPDQRDIIVRERIRQRRAVVLAVDVSGSMRGERIRSAAAAVGALVGELARDDLAVVAFWSDAAVLAPMGHRHQAQEVLDLLVRLPARGLTNVELPLRLAREELDRARGAEGRVLLLSDCVHNAGPDPRAAAAGLPRLDVLLDTTGEKDLDLGRDLARIGRGRLETVRSHRDIPAALSRILHH